MIEGKQPQISRAESVSVRVKLQLQDIVTIPLAALVFICLHTLISYKDSLIENFGIATLLMVPPLLIVIFGITFLYKFIRRQYRHVVAQIAAAVLSSYCVIAFVLTLNSEAEDFYFNLAVILFNPVMGQVLGVVAIVGMIFLLIRRKKYL